jgi:Trk-type K+ transport system membrane component
MDPEKSEWFTIFKIIFECTSAYSTIGLSLGTPNNNWSFCGEFGTASKLVVSLFLLLVQVTSSSFRSPSFTSSPSSTSSVVPSDLASPGTNSK